MTDELPYSYPDGEFRCKCTYAHIHHPVLKWCCALLGCNHQTGGSDEYVSCASVYGSAACRRHAKRIGIKTVRFDIPLYPEDYVEDQN